MFDNKNLKPGWKIWRFDQMATNVNVRIDNPSESGMEHYVGLEHLDSDSLKIRRWGTPDDVEATKLMFKKGDIIFGRRRAYQRKLGVAEFDGICSAHAMVLRAEPDVVLPEFLPFFMQSDLFMDRAVEISVGSLSPTINWKTLAAQQFELPPIVEQRRLATLLQELERVRDCVSAARNAADRLKLSIIDKEIPPLDGSASKWRTAMFGEYVEVIDPNPSHRYPKYVEDGVPLIATQDFVGEDGYSFGKCKRVDRSAFDEQQRRCRFDASDVVFARKGVIGLARRYGSQEKAFSHTVVVLKPRSSSLCAEFLLWFARSNAFMTELKRSMNSNSGVPTLGVKTIEGVPIWLPPVVEQQRVASLLDELHSAGCELDARLAKTKILKRSAIKEDFGPRRADV